MDAREHRIQLGQAVAEQLTQYLHTLSADAWHHPSACAGSEACEVVGHLALGRNCTRARSPEGCKETRRHQQGRPSLGCATPSARLRIGNVWETNCWQPSRDGLRTSTNCCSASARRIGRNPAIIPSGSARHSSLSPCGSQNWRCTPGIPSRPSPPPPHCSPTASRFLWNWFHVSCRSSACSQTHGDWCPCAVTLR